MSLVFRPQDISRRTIMQDRLKGYRFAYNWHRRGTKFSGMTVNQQNLIRMFGRLHYLACHAPEAVTPRYQAAYSEFMARHFGTRGRASARYLNRYSCHSWM